MGVTCVVKNAAFKETAKRLNLSENALERITFDYNNLEGNDGFPSDEYINQQFEPTNIVDKDVYDDAIRIWNEYYAEPITGSFEEIANAKKEARKFFGEDAMVIKPKNNGEYKLIVGEPTVEVSTVYNHMDKASNARRLINEAERKLFFAQTEIARKKIVRATNITLSEVYSGRVRIAYNGNTVRKNTKSLNLLKTMEELEQPMSRQEMDSVLELLGKKFNKEFVIVENTKEQFKASLGNEQGRSAIRFDDASGKFIIHINKDIMPSYTAFVEEMLHPLVRNIQVKNPKLFDAFLKECNETNEEALQVLVDSIINNRTYEQRGDAVVKNEIVTQCLSYKLKNANSKQTSTFKKIINAILEFLGIDSIYNAKENTITLDELAYILKFEDVKFEIDRFSGTLFHNDSLLRQDEVIASEPSAGRSTRSSRSGEDAESKKKVIATSGISVEKNESIEETFTRNQKTANSQIAFNSVTHTYIVGGNQADYSVTEFKDHVMGIRRNSSAFHEGASGIDSSMAKMARDFFMNQLKEEYQNMSKDAYKKAKEDLEALHESIKTRYGKDCKIITDECILRTAGTLEYNDNKITIAGTMDMVVIDKNGKINVLDFKTELANEDSEMSDDKKREYGLQTSLLIALLKARGYDVAECAHSLSVRPEEIGIKNIRPIRGTIEKQKEVEKRINQSSEEIAEQNNTFAEVKQIDLEDDDVHGAAYEISLQQNVGKAERLVLDQEEYATKLKQFFTRFDVSSVIRFDVSSEDSRNVDNPNVLYLMDRMMSNGFYPIYGDREVTLLEESAAKDCAQKCENLDYNKKTRVLKIPVGFTYGKSEGDLIKQTQLDRLLGTNLYTPSQLRSVSRGVMYQLSNLISIIQSTPNGYEAVFNKKAEEDYTKLSRIDIIQKIGLSNLLDVVKNRLLSVKESEGTELLKKKRLLSRNWNAVIMLGYDSLITLEEISISTKGVINTDVKTEIDDAKEQDDEEAIRELFGSSVEHWQVGFRQVSAFSSLSQLVKRFLDKLYVLDENGKQIEDNTGLGTVEHVNAQEAVAKLLAWTQGAASLEDKDADGKYKSNSMLAMLQGKLKQEPWVKQVIEALEGKKNDAGEIISKPDEQFKAQFYSNFKKYFQRYAITYKDNQGKILMSIINESQYSDTILDESKAKENCASLGQFKLRNKDGRLNDDNVKALTEQYNHLNELCLQIPRNSDEIKNHIDLNDLHKTIKSIVELLDIDYSNEEALRNAIPNKNTLIKFKDKIGYLIYGGNKDLGLTSDAVKKGNEKVTDIKAYKDIVKIIAEQMGQEMESVSYEAGKMYYSYVLPSYLGNLINKLKKTNMSDEEFEKFMQDEYLNYRWFNRDGKIKVRWLNEINNSKDVRENLKHVVSLHFMDEEYTDKTPASYAMSMVKAFLYDANKNWAYYRVPIQSNKPSEDYIKFRRIHDDYENVIADYLMDTYDQESERIRTVKIREQERKTANKLIVKKSFDKYGNRFAYLDWLNQYRNGTTEYEEAHNGFSDDEKKFSALLSQEIDGKDQLNRKDDSYQKFLNLLKEITKKNINKRFEEYKQLLIDEGAVTVDKCGKITDGYKGMNVTETELKEFYWNDMFAAINILELTVTDIAYYKNTEDLQKRLAQLHAPGMRANITARDFNGSLYSKDGKYRTITIADNVIKSEIKSNIEHLFNGLINAAKNDAEKSRLQKQCAYVSNSLNEVNFADAQGFTTPTAYRKKMGMLGKWSPRHEEAYNALMKLYRKEPLAEGETLSDYIDVMFQTLKPFTYSQIRKSSEVENFSNVLPDFKEGRQIKDSEFCLIMIAALQKNSGEKGTLDAIFDFMEGTLNTRGVPNGEGIDTIIFESASKSVKPGLVDLNNKTYEEAMAALGQAVKRKKDDGTIEYDETFVDVIPFEDYCIQQEMPKHFVGHEQAQGSQNRILAWSDIKLKDENGKDKTIVVPVYEETKDGEYKVIRKQLTMREARDRYFKAIADNIEISKNQIEKRFNISALDPKLRNIALSKILQEEILKDSRYGADMYWACSTNKNGEFNIPLSDPTQSNRIQQLLNSIIKNSINKQEIEGGPAVQVSSWGKSKKLHIRYKCADGKLLLTESEFNGEEELPKGYETKFKQKRDETSYSTYINGQNSVAYYECTVPVPNMSFIEDFGDENGIVDVDKIEEEYPELLEMIGYRIPTESKYSMVPMKIVAFTSNNSGENVALPAEITWQSGSDFDIDKLYIMLHSMIRTLENGKYVYKQPRPDSKQYNDNIIVDTQRAILTSSDVMEQFFTPGNFDELKMHSHRINYVQEKARRTGRSVDEIYRETENWNVKQLKDANYQSKNLIFNQTQIQFHKQNMAAGKLIGIFAQANVSHAFISLFDEEENEANKCFISISEGDEFSLDGINVSGDFTVDKVNSVTGKKTSSYIAELLAASVDAVKDPILNLININQETANFVTSLLRMGFSMETVSLLCAQPIVKEVLTDYNLENAGAYTTLVSVIADKIDQMSPTVKAISEITVTNESLISNLLGKNETTNYMVLNIMLRMQKVENAFRQITHMTKYNSITSAVGPFASDTILQRMQDEDFANNKSISNGIKDACDNVALAAFRDSSHGLESEIIGRNFIQAGSAFEMAAKCLKLLLHRNHLSEELLRKFSDFYMSYYVLCMGNTFDLSDKNREYMIKQFPQEVITIRGKYKDNAFLNAISFTKNKKEEFPSLHIRTRGMSNESIEDLKQSWVELFNNSETSDLAIRLAEYCFFRGSFGFSPKTFTSLMPNVVKTNLNGYVRALNKKQENIFQPGVDTFDRMIMQFILHNPKMISERYKTLNDYQRVISGPVRIIDRNSIDKNKHNLISEAHRFIYIGNDIYYANEKADLDEGIDVDENTDESEFRYDVTTLIKVDTLGGNGQGFEISTEEDFPKTIFSKAKKNSTSESTDDTNKSGNRAKTREEVDVNEEQIKVLINTLFNDNELVQLQEKTGLQIQNLINSKANGSVSLSGRRAVTMIESILGETTGKSASEVRKILAGAVEIQNDKKICR